MDRVRILGRGYRRYLSPGTTLIPSKPRWSRPAARWNHSTAPVNDPAVPINLPAVPVNDPATPINRPAVAVFVKKRPKMPASAPWTWLSVQKHRFLPPPAQPSSALRPSPTPHEVDLPRHFPRRRRPRRPMEQPRQHHGGMSARHRQHKAHPFSERAGLLFVGRVFRLRPASRPGETDTAAGAVLPLHALFCAKTCPATGLDFPARTLKMRT